MEAGYVGCGAGGGSRSRVAERARARIISCRILGTYPVFHVRVDLIDEAAKLVMVLIDDLVLVDDGILECRVGGKYTIKCPNIQSRVLLYQLPLLVRRRPRARSLVTADLCHTSRNLVSERAWCRDRGPHQGTLSVPSS